MNEEWKRFVHYMDHEVRAHCRPQRESLRGGPFEWLQTLSGKVFGERVGPYIVRFFLEEEMLPRENAGHDFVFHGRRIELKTGVEHSTAGVFLFEQIRPSQNWDGLLCIGIAAERLEFITLSRAFVQRCIAQWRKTEHSVIMPQHGGARGRAVQRAEPDTFWLWTKPTWDRLLRPHRASFGPDGWHGRPLQKSLLV